MLNTILQPVFRLYDWLFKRQIASHGSGEELIAESIIFLLRKKHYIKDISTIHFLAGVDFRSVTQEEIIAEAENGIIKNRPYIFDENAEFGDIYLIETETQKQFLFCPIHFAGISENMAVRFIHSMQNKVNAAQFPSSKILFDINKIKVRGQ